MNSVSSAITKFFCCFAACHLGAQAGTGVANSGSAGIAHIGNALALLQACDDALRRLGLIVLVYGQQLGAGAL